MIANSKKQILIENYNQADNGSMTLKEYVERESNNDPNFYSWLLDKELEQDFYSSLTEGEKEECKQFIESLDNEYKNVIEDYFNAKIVEEKECSPEFNICGNWYQVVNSKYFDNLPDDDEFGWVKKEPKHLYNNEYYYIIQQ